MEDSVELVMTIPEPYSAQLVYKMGCRTTIGTLVQLLAQARRRIIISAPFIQVSHGNVYGIVFDAVHSALLRGVSVDFLSTKSGIKSIKANGLIPGSYNRLQLYQTSANLNNEQMLGSHAKICVADSESAYVGSANLTSPGLINQLELGLLVHGKVAMQIEQFWDYSIELGLFVRIP